MGHDEDQDEPQEPPSLPSRLLNLGDGAREVVDADEEVRPGPGLPQETGRLACRALTDHALVVQVFILYTLHPAPAGRTGLGQVDSHHDVLAIRFDLDDDDMPEVESMAAAEASTRASSSSSKATKRTKGNSSSRGAAKTSAQASSSSRIEVIVNQDSTSLRSTSGDTGSVVWRSSVRLGACLARQVHKPPYGRPPLLNGSALADANILELGSGTGVLPAIMLPLLSRFGRAPNWVATDQEAMLPLLRKNMEQLAANSLMGGSAGVAEVDWVDCANQLRSKTAYAGGIEAVKRRVMEAFGSSTLSPDLVIAVDCVFK